ncbi:MAG: hypothetical protein WA417_03780 [Stellaceae bacterium]
MQKSFCRSCAAVCAVVVAAAWVAPALAQPGGNTGLIGDDGLIDAILATPNQKTPVPQDNLFATAPGLEQAARQPQFTLNALAPLLFNSNPEFRSSGGPQSLDGSPVARLGWASQLFGTPVRVSGFASLEWERFPSANDASIDYFRSSARMQYVNPSDDQAFSPFFSYVPRMDFDPTFGDNFATRQDLNLGFDKTFNFDRSFNRAGSSSDSSATTVWSFGFSLGAQQRFRDPAPGSHALLFAPSVSYVISDQWNASLSAPITRRWFNTIDGVSQKAVTLEPVGVLEFIIPGAWLGGPRGATMLGNPAVDFLGFHERNWSTAPGFAYGQWLAGLVLKAGWRF